MSTINQITYEARGGGRGPIHPIASTLRNPAETDRWLPRLDPALRSGKPPGRAYLNFGSQAALIRWYAEPGSRFDWDRAHVILGDPAVLTPQYALELVNLSKEALAVRRTSVEVQKGARGPLGPEVEARARSAEAASLLVPLLAHALQYQRRRVTMPRAAPGLPEAVMWGLTSILDMIGNTPRVSFLTYASGPSREADTAGLFVAFSDSITAVVPPDEGFRMVAENLADWFRHDPAGLRPALAERRVHEPAAYGARVGRLTMLPIRHQAGGARPRGTTVTDAASSAGENTWENEAVSHATTSTTAARPASDGRRGQLVKCPMCLHQIEDWDQQDRWRWDDTRGEYEKITLPPDANEDQRSRQMHAAYVCCPRSRDDAARDDTKSAHYLPASYGRFGDPVLLGFVGLTKSGKTHLLTSMVGKMGELSRYRISSRPLDPVNHQRFLEHSVRPLLSDNEVLPGTPEDVTTEFADAFVMRHASGPERVVVLFDVAGGDLARTDQTKEFLWIADGLFFVIDPDHLNASTAGGDETFTNVLNVIRDRPRPGPVSAAIVLNKADKVRFEDPVARWLRSADGGLSPVDFLRESADVYAYLDRNGAAMLAEEPYQVCDKATLHVASPTGGVGEGEGRGSKYPRGVTPMRVLRPLVAMLAMTGVLAGPEAAKVGV